MPEGLPARYVRPEPIARGGMGEIFVADDETLGRKVAIKLLAERFARDESIRQRFTREALAAARLSGHPNIVTIFDVGDAEGRPFIVMEYLPGGTVAERARGGPVSHEQALAWLAQAAEAIDEAHRHGIVHRDVKPANMLLDDRGGVHMGDFGIARVMDETSAGMTVAGTVLGTAGYLSPEQARGEPATPASDVYGLGVVAYELLTGGRPFQGGSTTAEAAAHIHEPVPPASGRGVGLPASVDRVFERALAKDPARRYAIRPRFRRRAAGRAHAHPADAGAGGRGTTSPGKSRPWLPVLVGVLIALLAAGVVLAATMAGDDDEPQGQQTSQTQAREVTVTTTREGTTVQETVTVEQPPPAPPPSPPPSPPPTQAGANVSMAEARELTDQATAAMREGDYAGAVTLAERALTKLRGTGDIYEAYALYDAGNSYAELGQCDKALSYLDASEAIQGQRREIDEARAKCS